MHFAYEEVTYKEQLISLCKGPNPVSLKTAAKISYGHIKRVDMADYGIAQYHRRMFNVNQPNTVATII